MNIFTCIYARYISFSATIGDLKRKLEVLTNVPTENQKLFFKSGLFFLFFFRACYEDNQQLIRCVEES